MTPVELRRSHDAMARFLLILLKHSDKKVADGYPRDKVAERHYREAEKLVHRAGLVYEMKEKNHV